MSGRELTLMERAKVAAAVGANVEVTGETMVGLLTALATAREATETLRAAEAGMLDLIARSNAEAAAARETHLAAMRIDASARTARAWAFGYMLVGLAAFVIAGALL